VPPPLDAGGCPCLMSLNKKKIKENKIKENKIRGETAQNEKKKRRKMNKSRVKSVTLIDKYTVSL
jgi:hypothetical protein